jgi:hypothetical protein
MRFVARYAQTSDRPAVGRAGGARSHLAPGAVGSCSAPVGQFCDYAAVRLRQCGRADRGQGIHGFRGYGRRGWAVRWEADWHRPVQLVRRAYGAGEAPRRNILGDSSAGGVLAGIGFTMALFIAGLALSERLLLAAKIGILTGSALCAVLGLALLL